METKEKTRPEKENEDTVGTMVECSILYEKMVRLTELVQEHDRLAADSLQKQE